MRRVRIVRGECVERLRRVRGRNRYRKWEREGEIGREEEIERGESEGELKEGGEVGLFLEGGQRGEI